MRRRVGSANSLKVSTAQVTCSSFGSLICVSTQVRYQSGGCGTSISPQGTLSLARCPPFPARVGGLWSVPWPGRSCLRGLVRGAFGPFSCLGPSLPGILHIENPTGFEPCAYSALEKSGGLWWAPRPPRVFASPTFDLLSMPHPSYCQVCLWQWEVLVAVYQLVYSLSRDTQNLGNLSHAHEIQGHALSLRKLLTRCNYEDILAPRQ